MLDVRDVTGGYAEETPVIHNINFDVRAQEIVGLIGMNGAGKSTILKTILGLLPPHEGKVRVDGVTLEEDPAAFRSKIAYIPETPKLYEELTLWEHMRLTAMVYKIDEQTFRARAERLLGIFRMSEQVDAFPGTFSKGMQQKVMILCAFLVEPALFIVDEPFVGLDPLAIQSLLELLTEMREQGASVLISTHILATAERYCDRFVLINRGRVALHGTLDDMREQAGMPGALLDEMFVKVVREP